MFTLVGLAPLYMDKNFRNMDFSIFCENHSTFNFSKSHNFGPIFMNEGFLEFKLQGEYFVYLLKYRLLRYTVPYLIALISTWFLVALVPDLALFLLPAR